MITRRAGHAEREHRPHRGDQRISRSVVAAGGLQPVSKVGEAVPEQRVQQRRLRREVVRQRLRPDAQRAGQLPQAERRDSFALHQRPGGIEHLPQRRLPALRAIAQH